MSKADETLRVHHCDERHASHFKDVDFLFVAVRHRVAGIRQADEWNFFPRPIFVERTGRIRADSQNLGAAARELFVIIPQARQLRAAIWSEKTTQKGEDDGLAAIIRKADKFSAHITDFKFRRGFTRMQKFRH